MQPANELLAAADQEMRANIHRPVIIQMRLPSIMGIVGLVQLASRHPGVSAEMRRGAREWVESIHTYLLNEGLRHLADLIVAGWEPAFDQPTETDGANRKQPQA